MRKVDSHLILRRSFLAFASLQALPLWLLAQNRTVLRLSGVEFEELQNGTSQRRYLLIHGDETTAREVLRRHMRTTHGTALLVTGTEREVVIEGAKLDPNRMFSREGAEKNLRKLNSGLSESRLQNILGFLDAQRDRLLEHILPPPGGLLIVLHNNRNGYSLEDEAPISDEVSLPRRSLPNEFMLVTAPRDFAILKKSPFNVLLQNQAPPDDDGSLSRLAARRGVRYVNIEAFLGRAEEQTRMLAWLEDHLPPKFN